MLKFTYWWCQDLNQWQIKQQLGLGSHTAVDWDMFCREVCEVALFDGREKIGGPGKLVRLMKAKLERESTIVDMYWRVSGFLAASLKIHENVLLRP